jgi:hypothetical protein
MAAPLDKGWKYISPLIAFLKVVYLLNIVAWGGMLFLLLCNAAPAMCAPSCNSTQSPRLVWIEIDSQILIALLALVAFGRMPFRSRDLYYLIRFRCFDDHESLRKLAAVNKSWVRLADIECLQLANCATKAHGSKPAASRGSLRAGDITAVSAEAVSNASASGAMMAMYAPVTRLWKIDFVVWLFILNTIFHGVLCGFMWGVTRYDRPRWAQGTFMALSFLCMGLARLMMVWEGRVVRKAEQKAIEKKHNSRTNREP